MRRLLPIVLAAAIVVVAGSVAVFAAPQLIDAGRLETPALNVPRVTRPPRLEDFLTNTPRQAEAMVSTFRQRTPQDGVQVSEDTRAYLSFDDDNLYVVFVCTDSSGAVRGHLAKREDIAEDDHVGLYLDTFRDRRHAYVFEANPLGVQRDGTLTEGQGMDFSFDTLWNSRGQIIEGGYVVWMAVPFKSLRFSNAADQTWGIALGRTLLRTNEDAYWPYITERVAGFVNQMSAMQGVTHIGAGPNIQLTPYTTFTGSHYLDDDLTFKQESEPRAGLDAKLVFKESVTVDATANPDFSQVESDEPQVTVNQRFEVRFPEKRPFFMDNASYFQTPLSLFYSRRIADPRVGSRVTGKTDGWAFGALVIDDQAEAFSASDRPAGGRPVNAVFRVQKEFASESSVGALVTNRFVGSTSNNVMSVDTRLKLSPNWILSSQLAGSSTVTSDGVRDGGAALVGDLTYRGRHVFHSTRYRDVSPDFRADVGYIRRTDLRFASEYLGYFWYPESSRVSNVSVSGTAWADWDYQGTTQDWGLQPRFEITLPKQTSLAAEQLQWSEVYEGLAFDQRSTKLSAYSSPTKWLVLSGAFVMGRSLNYAPVDGAPFVGTSRNTEFAVTWRPSERMRLENAFIFTGLNTGSNPPPGIPSGQTVFTDRLERLKANFQFTHALSLRAIMDYSALVPDESLIDYNRAKMVTGDVLLTYMIHPGTALYIGYVNRRENIVVDPGVPASFRLTNNPETVTGRQIFVKLSYLLQL